MLWLAFPSAAFAKEAARQHICLCRNEDMLLPSEEVVECPTEVFDTPWVEGAEHNFDGFELVFGEGPGAFPVGFNRFSEPAALMFGALRIVGNPGAAQ